jgi:Mg-chelatase subunit ChlD
MFRFSLPQPHQRRPERPQPARRRQEVIVLAADLSASMQQPFRLPGYREVSRLAALQEAAELFFVQKAAENPDTRVAVVGFGSLAWLVRDWTPLSRLPEILATLNRLRADGQQTNLAGAVSLALNRIRNFPPTAGVRRLAKVLLVTDGAGNVGTESYEQLIQRAQAERVFLHTVAICNRRDPPGTYDRDLLSRMAGQTRGYFNTAHNFEQLRQALVRA